MRGHPKLAFCTLSVLAMATLPASAQEQQHEAARTPVFSVRTSVKATGLTTSEALLRLRVEPDVRVGGHLTFNLAYEHQAHYAWEPSDTFALGVVSAEASTPLRARPLVWSVAESGRGAWRHQIDRANVHVRTRRADVTLGRQAIGWGRGVMFTAIDLFAPFSPLEVDREWRPGVDAVRADVKLTDRSSIDFVGAYGGAMSRSVFAARARGYSRILDVEVAGGRRAEDVFGGIASSAAAGDAEVHGEAAVFRAAAGNNRQAIWTAVFGGSYRFPVGTGILADGEYHYSGFGAVARRHAVGATGSYEASPELRYSAQWLHHPGDGSGVVAPGVTYTVNNAASVFGVLYVAYGLASVGRMTGLVQLRLYF